MPLQNAQDILTNILHFSHLTNQPVDDEVILTKSHISELFEKFTANFATKYILTYSLTIDEQLMLSKNRC